MIQIRSHALPSDSLLAKGCSASDYTDCFSVEIDRAVSLSDFITAFYNSPAFRPERWVLHAIGKGSGGADVRALAAGETKQFAAWSVEARTEHEILLRDFQQRTCSWLSVDNWELGDPPEKHATRLYFGSGVRRADGAIVQALMPFHRFYAKALLASAAKQLARSV